MVWSSRSARDAALQAIDLRVIALLLARWSSPLISTTRVIFCYAAYVALTRADSARALLWGILMLSACVVGILAQRHRLFGAYSAGGGRYPRIKIADAAVYSRGVIGRQHRRDCHALPQNMLIAQSWRPRATALTRCCSVILQVYARMQRCSPCCSVVILPHGPLAARRPPKPAFD